MQALLDTHALLWWLSDQPALTKAARATIADTNNLIFVSAASAWEIASKVRLGKLPTTTDLAADFAGHVEREGFQMLALSCDHAIRAGLLPGPHRDLSIACSSLRHRQIIFRFRAMKSFSIHTAYAVSGD